METVAQPPADAELHLLTEWGDRYTRKRSREAAVASIAVHVALILGLVLAPVEAFKPAPPPPERQRVTPLVEPLTELTQRAPNTGKITKQFDATELEPRPRVQTPVAPPSTSRPRALRQAAMPPAPVPRPAAPVPLPEPPKLDAGVKEAPKPELPQPVAPPPQIQPAEKPKLAFENPTAPPTAGSGITRAPAQSSAVSDAIRQTIRSGGGGVTVGDPEAVGAGGAGSGVNLPPSPGSQASNLQLLSDPLGVDFRPYLARVLASVKLHWLAILPESARLGRRGRVGIQFSIARDGSVPKLVIASASGADALDKAAVAGISASVPFPPLPAEFKGDRIVLQFNFAYNMPK